MLKQPITFDRFIRSVLVIAALVALGLLVNRLSGVLLPFFIAWLLAYMMYPLVHFLEVKCRLRFRILSIIVALLLVGGVLTGLTLLLLPMVQTEFIKVGNLISTYAKDLVGSQGILIPYIDAFIKDFEAYYTSSQQQFLELIQQEDVIEGAKMILSQLWLFLQGTFNFIIGIIGSLIVLLYLIFILLDYEHLSDGWLKLVPEKSRAFVSGLVHDVQRGMNSYFRGQALVAFCVGILFAIGFALVGFPMGIALGLFMGFLNLVPYLQTLGFVPMVILAMLESADTGENFWFIILPAVAVLCVVQVIQDMYLVPRIMGHQMGLKPAVILLSLSVWGSLLGFIGLIIALPLTTLVESYYRRYVLEEGHKDDKNA